MLRGMRTCAEQKFVARATAPGTLCFKRSYVSLPAGGSLFSGAGAHIASDHSDKFCDEGGRRKGREGSHVVPRTDSSEELSQAHRHMVQCAYIVYRILREREKTPRKRNPSASFQMLR